MNLAVGFAPLLPWPLLAVLGGAALLLLAVAAGRGGRGWVLRALATTLLVAALANPSVVREEHRREPDLALIVVDESASQNIGDRRRQAGAALAALRKTLAGLPDLEVKVVRAAGGGGERGTRLFAALERSLADEQKGRLAALVLITDGMVHDPPGSAGALPGEAPLHVLLTGAPGERDRRVAVIKAPAYGLVGGPVEITYRVDDDPPPGAAEGTVEVRFHVDGKPAGRAEVATGRPNTVRFTVAHAGPTVIEIAAAEAPGEISPANNRAVVTLSGVRDRLKVLLISGQPHAGERTWRNLLKSDPAVDLVHFTILRPPEKEDMATLGELSLIAFPVRELFEEKLGDFDLVVFDRYVLRGVLPWRYLARTADYVRGGGALLLAVGPEFAGLDSLDRTPLGAVMPAASTGRILERAYRPRITGVGRRHPVTSALPGEEPMGDAGDAASGQAPPSKPRWGRWFRLIEAETRSGTALMEGPGGRPLLVVDRAGEGRVAQLLSDQLWLWARGFEGGGPDAELVRRLVHWLMKEPELEEERLSARIENGRLVIERRSLDPTPHQVTVTAPGGTTRTLGLEPGPDGIARNEAPAPALGLYRVSDGVRSALAAGGPLNAEELADLRATADELAPLVRASGGAIAWLGEGVPEVRRVRAGAAAAGRGWIGVPRTGYSLVTGSREVALLPALLVLAAALALFAAAWWREGR